MVFNLLINVIQLESTNKEFTTNVYLKFIQSHRNEIIYIYARLK